VSAYTNTPTGAAPGVAATTANTGGACGDALTVNVAGAGAVTFDDSAGPLAYKIEGMFDGGSAMATIGWDWDPTDRGGGRMELYLPAYPPPESGVLVLAVLAPQIGHLYVDADGLLVVNPVAGGTLPGSTLPVPLNTWFRIEWDITHTNPDGAYLFAVFADLTSETPTETFGSVQTWPYPYPFYQATFGQEAVYADGTYWIGNITINDTGLPGSVPPPPAPVVLDAVPFGLTLASNAPVASSVAPLNVACPGGGLILASAAPVVALTIGAQPPPMSLLLGMTAPPHPYWAPPPPRLVHPDCARFGLRLGGSTARISLAGVDLRAPAAAAVMAATTPVFLVTVRAPTGPDGLVVAVQVASEVTFAAPTMTIYGDVSDTSGALSTQLVATAPLAPGTWWWRAAIVPGRYTAPATFTVNPTAGIATAAGHWSVDPAADPAPHLWLLTPPHGQVGDTVTAVGAGLAATLSATLGGVPAPVTAVRVVAPGVDAYTGGRIIDAVTGDVTVGHDEVDVTIPPGTGSPGGPLLLVGS